jgi:membrane-associated phospholipid phosphatase
MGRKTDRRAALKFLTAAPLGLAATAALAHDVRAGASGLPLRLTAPSGLVDQDAGTWKTWLLASGSQRAVPAPPDSASEIDQVRAMAGQRDAATLDRIAYWDAGPAPYRWTEIAIDLAHVKNNLSGSQAARAFALMSAAMYDALIVAWGAKYANNRARPSMVDPSLTTAVAVSPTPSYPCEHATAAGAASVILAHLFPGEADSLSQMAEEAGRTRVIAGVQYPSDVAAGLELGRAVGAAAVERARSDNFEAKGNWVIPTETGQKWTGPAAVNADESLWKPWVLASGSQLRPGPPPAFDSPEMATDLAEIKNFPRTPLTNGIALNWQYVLFGGPNLQVYWMRQASRRILEERWDFNAVRAAQVYLAAMVAYVDTWIAVQDTKFAYWGIRPFQLDPTLTTVFPTPPFPSYPSNRASFNTSMARILASYFPREAEVFRATGEQISESAIWAGIHFRTDIRSAQGMGSQVAQMILERMS